MTLIIFNDTHTHTHTHTHTSSSNVEISQEIYTSMRSFQVTIFNTCMWSPEAFKKIDL